ncbi:sigma-70 family RNA polymerase sigma factor [Myxococcota bacterium]|nr:sigma-70 family RNA polymerase sigma factor [Myxococcota bacterium]
MTLFLERRELLVSFRLGERRALEETYRHYAPIVASFLARGFVFRGATGTFRFRGYVEPFDLDNAVAETFVRAFREPARLGYDGLNPYKSYLLTIARNLVIDELRRRDFTASGLVEDLESAHGVGDALVEPASAEESVLAKELAGLCARFVGHLGERERTFFEARFEEARTQVDAGQRAGLSHMQARTLEKRLRGRFLRFLKTSGYLEGYQGETVEGAP